jgi:hypothetical protein
VGSLVVGYPWLIERFPTFVLEPELQQSPAHRAARSTVDMRANTSVSLDAGHDGE